MQIYKIFDDAIPDSGVNYRGTFTEATASAKERMHSLADAQFRSDIRVDLIECPSDKAGFVAAKNGGGDEKVLRSWKGTNRCGLQEIQL
jgi:hypothetical protein